MFGRVGRAARRLTGQAPIRAYGVLHVFNPQTVAGVAAVGLGTAGIGAGAATAQTRHGPVSAVGQAVSRTLAWGEQAQRQYLRLPGRVLVTVSDDAVKGWEWTVAGAGKPVIDWPRGAFTAQRVHFTGERGVEVTLPTGKKALLTTRSITGRRRSAATVEAIAAAAQM